MEFNGAKILSFCSYINLDMKQLLANNVISLTTRYK